MTKSIILDLTISTLVFINFHNVLSFLVLIMPIVYWVYKVKKIIEDDFGGDFKAFCKKLFILKKK